MHEALRELSEIRPLDDPVLIGALSIVLLLLHAGMAGLQMKEDISYYNGNWSESRLVITAGWLVGLALAAWILANIICRAAWPAALPSRTGWDWQDLVITLVFSLLILGSTFIAEIIYLRNHPVNLAGNNHKG